MERCYIYSTTYGIPEIVSRRKGKYTKCCVRNKKKGCSGKRGSNKALHQTEDKMKKLHIDIIENLTTKLLIAEKEIDRLKAENQQLLSIFSDYESPCLSVELAEKMWNTRMTEFHKLRRQLVDFSKKIT